MNIAIIISSKDLAGMNIKRCLVNEYNLILTNDTFRGENILKINDEVKIYTLDSDTVYSENLDDEIDADLFIFATRHKSEKGVPTLSVHSPGNFFKAEYGGIDKTLNLCPASYLKKGLQFLEKNKIEGFEVIQECTHHGPFMKRPVMFIEIGSNMNEWENIDAGKVIAKTIIELVNSDIVEYKSAFGVGGLHHTPNFKKIQLNSDISIGHVCPKYNLKNLDKDMVLQAMEKTVPKSEIVIVDWKGLGEHKERIVTILNELNIKWTKTKDY